MRLATTWMVALVLALAGCSRSAAPAEPAREQAPAVRVEVWHDTVCPWCRIGLHNLETVLASWDGPRIEVVHKAYLLEPNMPPEGVDMHAHMARKMGGEERVAAAHARVTEAGARHGVRFDFGKMTRSPATAPSHALVDWAPPEKRGAVIAGIHRAHFEEGRYIGDAEVLASVAADAGLDPAAARAAVTDPARLARVREEAASGAQAGVRGVPHFVIGGQVLRGAQPPEAIRQALLDATASTNEKKEIP